MTTSLKGGASTGEIQINGVTKLTIGDNGILTATVTPTSATPKALATMDAVAAADAVVTGQMLGVGQAWQNMTASRALGTTYTNNTGKPIVISVYWYSTVSTQLNIYVDGVIADISGYSLNSIYGTGRTTVPAGATYLAAVTSGTQSLGYWSELR